MGAYAWCYYTNDGRQYWTEAFKMRATDFAIIVSGILGIEVLPKDLASLTSKDVRMKQKYNDKNFIRVDWTSL